MMNGKRYFADFFVYFVLLFLFWIILASRLDFQTIFTGVIISSALVFFNRHLIAGAGKILKMSIKKFFYLFVFLYVLLVDIFKANFDIAILVLSPKLPISPSVTTLKTPIKNDFLKSLLSNAITLTPGTVTLLLEGDTITVHCLTDKAKSGLENWKVHRVISSLEGE